MSEKTNKNNQKKYSLNHKFLLNEEQERKLSCICCARKGTVSDVLRWLIEDEYESLFGKEEASK